ncbi:MAG: CDP-diacylglycerol--glycerol-3-phosphate 3-phosphatidyltransferase [Lachnospiraceae bacterium]|nr:CDP-diacylglycerol--glycerol-3-phosphate 3-phosphatidyltransferase [Lachnospiraceae bacterium]
MNLPNQLTILRILLIPFFVFFFVFDGIPAHEYIALVIYVVACLTDLADGKIARKYNLVTTFGKFMDPLADKILVITALILFAADGRLNAIALIIIVAREFIVSGFRLVASDKGIVIAAGMWGKVKTTVQMIMAIALMIHLDQQWFFIVEQVLIWASVLLTIISLVDYISKNREVLKEEQ